MDSSRDCSDMLKKVMWCSGWCCLTDDVTIGESEWFECVETGKGHQVETAVHRVVHTHHSHIPANN